MSSQYKSGAAKRKERQIKENEAKRGRRTLFDFGWISDTQKSKQIKLPSKDSKSENIFPHPSCATSETSIELELDSDNSEEYSTSSKTDEGTHMQVKRKAT